MKGFGLQTLLILLILAPAVVHANALDMQEEVQGSQQVCSSYFKQYERKYQIPNNLLHAIATIESSMRPFAVNHEGKSYYFNTSLEATLFAENLKKSGKTNFDIGCMQVNHYFHGDKFASIAESFVPEKNIDYAASYLRSLYKEIGSWTQAISAYHAGQSLSSKGKEYARKIINEWLKLS
jgi:soluble lytic murein transglycosylase-like protein